MKFLVSMSTLIIDVRMYIAREWVCVMRSLGYVCMEAVL